MAQRVALVSCVASSAVAQANAIYMNAKECVARRLPVATHATANITSHKACLCTVTATIDLFKLALVESCTVRPTRSY